MHISAHLLDAVEPLHDPKDKNLTDGAVLQGVSREQT